MITFPPGAMSRQQAYEYVGGKTVFAALERAFPEVVQPVYSTGRLTVYRRADLDDALARVRLAGEPLTNQSSVSA